MSLLLDAATRHKDELRRQEVGALRTMSQAWLDVENSLVNTVETLSLQLERSDIVTLEQLQRLERYRRLEQQIDRQLVGYQRLTGELIERQQRVAVRMGILHGEALINAGMRDAGLTLPFDRLPVETVEAIVGFAGDSTPLGELIRQAGQDGAAAMRRELVTGVALGRNPNEMARRALRQGLGTTFTRTATIYRTETLRAYRYTSIEAYKRSGVVTGYRRLSAKDSRTCVACLMADGQIYELEQEFDQHPNCRCTAVPVIRGVNLPYVTGQEWFGRQPVATQRELLGTTRYNLWREGNVELAELVRRVESPRWGGALQPTPVRELIGGR